MRVVRKRAARRPCRIVGRGDRRQRLTIAAGAAQREIAAELEVALGAGDRPGEQRAASLAIYGRLELTAPWGIRIPGAPQLAFYAIASGRAVLEAAGRRYELGAGDLVFIRKELAYTLKDHPRSRAATIAEVFAQRGGRCGGLVIYGHGGAASTIISGGFAFETTELDPLRPVVPDVLHVVSDGGTGVRWLDATLQLMATEMATEAPGYELVAGRLADVMFVHALRSHMRAHPCSASWLTAINDPQLGAAFQRMHERPGDPWTVDTLARAASMSRSAFAMRFKQALGQAPLTYLTRWRMHRASELLGSSTLAIAEIASSVGYETESSFSKVFKRAIGDSPAAYRKKRRDAAR